VPIHDWARVDAGLFHDFHYVEAVAVGDGLPDTPLFLKPEFYVPAPLANTYQLTWEDFPSPLKGLLETKAGNGPKPDHD